MYGRVVFASMKLKGAFDPVNSIHLLLSLFIFFSHSIFFFFSAVQTTSPRHSPPENKRSVSPSPLTASQLNTTLHNLTSSNTKYSQPLSTPSPSTTLHITTPFNASVTTLTTPNSSQFEGKEFFKQARQRLDYGKFNELIAGIKDLNAHVITTDQCLESAWDIFGDQNTDLYYSFKKMLVK